ncbi:MAG TPA: nucleotidyltransferase family protein [Myxococcaceae bacterium]|nr:nucleotidyltransferase family protein [Myxococcaceae bacterium]
MEARHPNHPGDMGTDASLAEAKREQGELSARAVAIQKLTEAGVPFVVGGAYAYAHYTGIYRDTKDLDLFPRRADAPRALEVLAADGWRTERTDEVWLYKAFRGEWFVDFIFSSGNGVAVVDDEWFAHAQPGVVFGQPVLIAPPEEIIWSKAFVLERERFDGSDVIHLIRAAGPKMDWERVLRRFDRHWEVLLAHLQLFRFAYPTERSTVPRWLMVELLSRSLRSVQEGDWPGKMCRGNLISRVNFEVDIASWGYQDGRRWDEKARAGGAHAAGSDREGPAGGRR